MNHERRHGQVLEALPDSPVGQAGVDVAIEPRDNAADNVRRDIAGKAVSGASGGIGQELIRAFDDAGAAEIIAASRHPIAAERAGVRPYKLDVTIDAEVAEAGRQFADRMLALHTGEVKPEDIDLTFTPNDDRATCSAASRAAPSSTSLRCRPRNASERVGINQLRRAGKALLERGCR